MHRVTACADGSKFEEKVLAHSTATTCSSYCSYSSIQFLFFCSYSFVDWQHQGRIPRDRKNPIDSRTIMGFLLDEVINPGGEFYAGLSSILITGAMAGEGTSHTNKEASGSKDQAYGSKN
jgi:hypothetical protein